MGNQAFFPIRVSLYHVPASTARKIGGAGFEVIPIPGGGWGDIWVIINSGPEKNEIDEILKGGGGMANPMRACLSNSFDDAAGDRELYGLIEIVVKYPCPIPGQLPKRFAIMAELVGPDRYGKPVGIAVYRNLEVLEFDAVSHRGTTLGAILNARLAEFQGDTVAENLKSEIDSLREQLGHAEKIADNFRRDLRKIADIMEEYE